MSLSVAVGAVHRRCLVGEAEGAHAGLRDAPAALPGGADGETDAAVTQPAAVTLVVFLEAPGSVELADQCQPGLLVFAGIRCLLEAERPRDEENRACKEDMVSLHHLNSLRNLVILQ